jgi:ribonucleoside-diphosphate reductase alpha chain
VLPLDTLDMLAQARGGYVEVDRSSTLDWDALRKKIAKRRHAQLQLRGHCAHGHHLQHHRRGRLDRACFGNLSVKSNLSGEFTVINHYLVRDLKRLGLWDDVMVMDLKHFDGSLRPIDRVPQEIKALYATAFEVEPRGWSKPPRAARSGSTRRRA